MDVTEMMNTFEQEIRLDPFPSQVALLLELRTSDIDASIAGFEELFEQGSFVSGHALGDIYGFGRFGVEENIPKAEYYLKEAKAMGSKEGAYRLARLYEKNKKSKDLLTELIQLSASDFSPASFLLGDLYFKGELVEKNIPEARKYFGRSWKQGNIFGRQWVGHLKRQEGGILNWIKGTMIILSTVIPLIRARHRDAQSNAFRRW